MKVRVVGTLKQPGRCAFCHDALEALAHPCQRCGAWLHLDCWEELKACTSPGCEQEAPSRESTAPAATQIEGRAHLHNEEDLRAWAREAHERRLQGPTAIGPYFRLLTSLAGYLVVLAGLIGLVWFGVREGIPAAWTMAKAGDSPLLSMLGMIGPLSAVIAALAYQLFKALGKWPRAWTDTRRLLHQTRPEPRIMKVWNESAGDSFLTFASFSRLDGRVVPGMAQIQLERFFVAPPRWLFEICVSKPVLVYDLGTSAPPFLIEDASGQLALIHA